MGDKGLRTVEFHGDTDIVTMVRLEEGPGHDRVSVWNRGGHSGTLTVKRGDGEALALLLKCGYTAVQIARMHEIVTELADGESVLEALQGEAEKWVRGQGWG